MAAKEARTAGTKAAASDSGAGAGAGEEKSSADAVRTAENATKATTRTAKRALAFIFFVCGGDLRTNCRSPEGFWDLFFFGQKDFLLRMRR
ncbi:unnamed protein product [Cuscuta campestris]|uniref:Uncharacterized protein n=1 Tax=Cuscuta campestris TaxID=132261 RepID=A0A484LCH4_9ASTE|nr:unnamed protein product [Cuscuta campestris]